MPEQGARTPVFSQKPFLKPEREAIDPPTHPNTWTGAKVHYIHLQGQEADPSMGLSPSQTVGSPREASYRLSPSPLALRGSFGPDSASRSQSWRQDQTRPASPFPGGAPPGRCRGDRAAVRAASLQGSLKLLLRFAGDKHLRFSVLHPHPFPLLRTLCFCPRRRRWSRSSEDPQVGCCPPGAWWDHLPAHCLLSLPVALAEGSPSGGV